MYKIGVQSGGIFSLDDYEKGFAMCVVKKVFGDQYAYIRKMVDKSYENTLTSSTNKVTKCLIAKLFGKDKQ